MFVAGRLPQEADHIDWEDWRFTIMDMDNRIIDKVQAKKINKETTNANELTDQS